MAAGAGLLADRVLGELPIDPHPVALFGDAMRRVEDRVWRDERAAGVRYAALGTAIGVGGGLAVRSTAAATFVSTAGRMLGDVATGIGRHLEEGDLDRARAALPALVGRDPSALDEKELARAVVESVAENTVDAVVAPAFWAVVAGAPGAFGHRAVNTMDAMVGHRSARYERFGWASARLDDAANYVPARVTAALVAMCRPGAARDVVRVVRRDAGAHPSPNAGVAEAAFAAALGVRLGGTNRYGDRTEHRAELGDGSPPRAADVRRAVALSRDVTGTLAAVLLAAGAVGVGRRVRGRA